MKETSEFNYNKTIKCYWFCSVRRYNELVKNKITKPDNNTEVNNRKYAYDYLFKDKNKGDREFFTWASVENKYDNVEENINGDYYLLELDVPNNLVLITDYYNWCDFIYMMELSKGNIVKANDVAVEEFGALEGFKTIYDSIFVIKEDRVIQNIIPYIKSEWIISSVRVSDKIV